MKKLIGIRREDKNIWERRVPIIPEHVLKLKNEFDIDTVIQPFPNRCFDDKDFINSGAQFNEDISSAPFILAVKEIPLNLLLPNKVYMFFSHTIKGQLYNMPLLKKVMDLKSTLIDYECITNNKNQRLVFFGRYAGLAGMIETLNVMGKKYSSQGIDSPFDIIKQAYQYHDIDEAKSDVKRVSEMINSTNKNLSFDPIVVGFTGYGNVSQGAQEIFDLLPFVEISPNDLLNKSKYSNEKIVKVVFKEEDMAESTSGKDFDLQDYYNNPQNYTGKFSQYIPFLDVLINAIYWDEKYPRLITKEYVKNNFENLKLKIICDISCDINGAIEFTEKVTMPDNPAYTYNSITDKIEDGILGEGIVNIAIDNLPTELPRDSSTAFSKSLYEFIPKILEADLNLNFDSVQFPEEIRRAVIVYKGELTKKYKYLEKFVD